MKCNFQKTLITGLCLFSLSIYGLPSDSEQPLTLVHDNAEMNGKTGITVLTGDVIIDQGTLHITGDVVTIHRNQNGDIDHFVAQGKPAHYQQIPNKGEGLINGDALTIEYYPTAEKIKLTEQAHLDQDGSLYDGEEISYDIRNEIVTAKGGRGTGQRQRTRVVLQPNK